MPAQTISSTTQQFLDIYDINNDLVITKKGTTSIILTVMAMNFDLLAEPEQDSMIYGYAGLLNSLNYPIQILIRSQTKDASTYLNLLKSKEDETINRLKKSQLRAYREFVADLIQERNVLDKKFYVVIPASPIELGLISGQSVIPGVKTPQISSFDRSFIVERAKNLLEPRRDHLISQFARIGLSATQLNTQEIIQLFYAMYNSEAAEGQRMSNSRSYTMPLVEGTMEESIFGKPTQHLVEQHMVGQDMGGESVVEQNVVEQQVMKQGATEQDVVEQAVEEPLVVTTALNSPTSVEATPQPISSPPFSQEPATTTPFQAGSSPSNSFSEPRSSPPESSPSTFPTSASPTVNQSSPMNQSSPTNQLLPPVAEIV